MTEIPPGGYGVSIRRKTPGEKFTFRTAREALEDLGTDESIVLAKVIENDSNFDFFDNDFPDMQMFSGIKPLKASLEDVREDSEDEVNDFETALDYLTEETADRNPEKDLKFWEDEQKRYSGYRRGRFMEKIDDRVVLPPVTLCDLFDLMVESSTPNSAQRKYVDRIRDGEELEVEEYEILRCYMGEPGLLQTVENDDGVEIYSWIGGELEEDVYDAVGPEGCMDVYKQDGLFHVYSA